MRPDAGRPPGLATPQSENTLTTPPPDTSTFALPMTLPVAMRTLLAAGFVVESAQRQGSSIEIACHREDPLGATIPYLIVLYDAPPAAAEVEQLERFARAQHRIAVRVAAQPTDVCTGWTTFIEALGGAVPTWQALAPTYPAQLATLAGNQLPQGIEGEAWALFERAVADGFEFCFGRRVRRQGGGQRGQRVSDLLAQTPDQLVLVVDAKAAKDSFDATWPALRALGEYVEAQKVRQQGQVEVAAAVVVSRTFKQKAARLGEISADFVGEHRLPLTFLPASVLGEIVAALTARPDLRNAIRWASLLGRGGLVTSGAVQREVTAAAAQRLAREPHVPPSARGV